MSLAHSGCLFWALASCFNIYTQTNAQISCDLAHFWALGQYFLLYAQKTTDFSQTVPLFWVLAHSFSLFAQLSTRDRAKHLLPTEHFTLFSPVSPAKASKPHLKTKSNPEMTHHKMEFLGCFLFLNLALNSTTGYTFYIVLL